MVDLIPLPLQDRVELAVGRTCLWWSTIEHTVHDFILHMAVCLSLDFDKSVNRVALHMALSNMDFREMVATAKAYASQVPAIDRTFYPRVEKLLNRLDNELRAERNRYVHDLWMTDGELVERIRQGTVVTRPQSHQLALTMATSKQYTCFEEVEAFVEALAQAYFSLAELDSETASIAARLERLAKLEQQDPEATGS